MDELDQGLDTSTETTTVETSTGDDGGSGIESATSTDQGDGGKPDWRVEKYGADWENSHQYWRDTASYWRGETDKEKKRRQQSARGIEDDDNQPASTARREPDNGNDPYADVNSVKDVFDRFEQKLADREINSNFRSEMRQTREKEQGYPEYGLPPFAEMEQEVLAPLVRQHPELLQVFKRIPTPGKSLYTLAFAIKYGGLEALENLFATKIREEMGKKINEVSNQAVRVKGGKDGPTNVKLTPDQIRNMSTAEFSKLHQKQTGKPL